MRQIVGTLRAERTRIETEMKKIGTALSALGGTTNPYSRHLSASARRRTKYV